MNKNDEKEKQFNKFVEKQINIINEYFEGEEHLNDIINKKANKKRQLFILLDKEWVEKWKENVGYENIKNKCKQYFKDKKKNI